MAVKTLYLKNVTVNGALSLQDGGTAPTGALTATGWTVAKLATPNFSLMAVGTKRASTAFATTDALTTPTLTAASSWRSEQPFTGVFANTNWSLAFRIRASVASAQTGAVKVRIWKSTSADGSTGNTQLTSGILTGTTTAALSTTVSATSTVTWTPGASQTFNNEYLFVQCEWSVVVASGSNTGDAVFYVESAGAITTSDFVLTVTGPLAATEAIDTASITGSGNAFGPLSATDAIDTSSITGTSVTSGVLAATEAIDTASLTGDVSGSAPVTNVAFRGRTIVESFNGTVTWPTGTTAGDSAVLVLLGNGSLTHNGAGWTLDVDKSAINDQGSFYSVWSKVGLSADDIAAPFQYFGTDYGGYDLYVVSGADSATLKTNNPFVSFTSTNTLAGFTKSPNSSLISTIVVDRNNVPVTPTVTSPAGFADRAQSAMTYFTINNADIASSSYTNGANVTWSGLDSSMSSGAVLYEFTAPGGGALPTITGTAVLSAGASTLTGVGVTASTGTGVIVAGTSLLTGSIGVTGSTGTGVIVANAAIITSTGVVASTGTLAATGAIDTASITGTSVTSGTLVATDTIDTANFTVTSITSGTLTATGAIDTANFTAIGASSGNGIITAGSSTLTGLGVTASIGAGTLVVGVSTVAGVGVTASVGTAVIAASPSAVLGSGIVISVGQGVGQLAAGSATLTGIASAQWISSGTLSASVAAVSGSGASAWVATGVLSARQIVVVGTGSAFTVTNGVLTAPASTLSGSGASASTGLGTVVANSSIVVGAGRLVSQLSGTLVAQSSAITGAGVTASRGTGVLVAGTSTILGTSGPLIVLGNAVLTAGSATLNGVGITVTYSTGALNASASTLTGSGFIASVGTGVLVTSAAHLVGAIALATAGTGTLVSQSASVFGTVSTVYSGAGSLNSSAAAVAGTGQVFARIVGTGTLVAANAIVASGVGQVLDRILGTGDLVVASPILAGDGKVYFDLPGVGVLVAGTAKIVGHGAGELEDIDRTIHGIKPDRITVSSALDRVATGYPADDRVLVSPNGETREVEAPMPVRVVPGSTHSRVI